MAITKSAIKKIRLDKYKTIINRRWRRRLKSALDTARAKPSTENLNKTFSLLDRAAKKHVIHKNKASRLKSRLTKTAKRLGDKKEAPKTSRAKKPSSKASQKKVRAGKKKKDSKN